jgi:hypothetical protein
MHGFTDQEVKQCFLYIFYRHNTNQTHRRFIKSLSYRERIVSAAFIPCIVPSSCVSIGPSKPTLGIRQGRAASGARNARTVRRTWIRDNAFSLHGHLLRTRAMVGRVKSDRLLAWISHTYLVQSVQAPPSGQILAGGYMQWAGSEVRKGAVRGWRVLPPRASRKTSPQARASACRANRAVERGLVFREGSAGQAELKARWRLS